MGRVRPGRLEENTSPLLLRHLVPPLLSRRRQCPSLSPSLSTYPSPCLFSTVHSPRCRSWFEARSRRRCPSVSQCGPAAGMVWWWWGGRTAHPTSQHWQSKCDKWPFALSSFLPSQIKACFFAHRETRAACLNKLSPSPSPIGSLGWSSVTTDPHTSTSYPAPARVGRAAPCSSGRPWRSPGEDACVCCCSFTVRRSTS